MGQHQHSSLREMAAVCRKAALSVGDAAVGWIHSNSMSKTNKARGAAGLSRAAYALPADGDFLFHFQSATLPYTTETSALSNS